MAYNNRLFNQPPLVHSQHYRSPNISLFANEVFPVGHSLPDVGLPSGHFRNPMDMREAFLREIEKESIREKIIAEEIARTRFLNAEVRLEEEWALQRGEQLPSPEALLKGLERRFPLLEQLPPHRSAPIGQRVVMGTSAAGMTTGQEFSQFEVVRFKERRVESRISELPFRQWNAELSFSEMPFKNHSVEYPILDMKYPYDTEKLSREQKICKEGTTSMPGKENAKLLAKPSPYHHHLSGAKRRADTAAEPLKVISSNFSRTEVPRKMKDECSPTRLLPKVKKGKAEKAVSIRALVK